jgi:DNA replication protein DnaC
MKLRVYSLRLITLKSQWDTIFADATMTVAAIARLVHHATIIEIRQESFRQKTALARSNCRGE